MDERITGKILVIIPHYISMVGGTNANKCVTKETNYVVFFLKDKGIVKEQCKKLFVSYVQLFIRSSQSVLGFKT